MLASADTIVAVADAFRKHKPETTVVDPVSTARRKQLCSLIMFEVMVSTSGSTLLPESAISLLIQLLLPLTTVLTPNLPEAELLLKTASLDIRTPESVDDIITIAKHIQKLGPKYVLVKGGHLPMTKGRLVSKEEAERHIVLNVLLGPGDNVTVLETEYQKSRNTHGTGCSLACKFSWCQLEYGVNL